MASRGFLVRRTVAALGPCVTLGATSDERRATSDERRTAGSFPVFGGHTTSSVP